MKIPNRGECLRMLKEHEVPDNIIAHSIAVTDIAMELGQALKSRGEDVNLPLLEAAALLHDICKYEGLGKDVDSEIKHPEAGATLLRKKGYHEIADIVEVHGFGKIFEPRRLDTWEKKLVYYADKRVTHDKRVGLKDRLDYLINRYPHGADIFRKAEPLLLRLEKEIFESAGIGMK